MSEKESVTSKCVSRSKIAVTYDLTSTLSKYLDKHMIFHLLFHHEEENSQYDKKSIWRSIIKLSERTNMVDLGIDCYEKLGEKIPQRKQKNSFKRKKKFFFCGIRKKCEMEFFRIFAETIFFLAAETL